MRGRPLLLGLGLGLSLALNAALALPYLLADRASGGPRMSCAEATNEVANKAATRRFAAANGDDLAATHAFLRASDYRLRNLHQDGDQTVFVYIARHYPQTCGHNLPGIDGSIVRLRTDMAEAPRVVGVE
ncbi:MAG: hypothetical protein AAF675_03845 [Pseudomonadota bacterium]